MAIQRSKKEQMEYDALVKEYKKLAKKADASLRATEAYQWDKNFGIMIKWAYAKAQKDIQRFGGGKRFDTKPPESKAVLQAKINAIKDYLDSPTRTKTGVRKIFVEKANTINENYGTNFKWNEIGEFFESEAWERLTSIYGSKTAIRVVGGIESSGEDVINKINEYTTAHKRVLDSNVKKLVDNLLKDNEVEIDDLY